MNLFADLLQQLDRQRSTSPLLTWYGNDGRIELSGRVYANWVIKTLNLLESECEVEPGATVALPPAPHWKTLVIGHAALALGASLQIADAATAADLTVVPDGQASPGASALSLHVALAPLARKCAKLPAGAVDWSAEVAAQPDALIYVPPVDPSVECVPGIAYADAAQWLTQGPTQGPTQAGSGAGSGVRTALQNAGSLDSLRVLATLVAQAASAGSLVCFEGSARESDLAAERATLLTV